MTSSSYIAFSHTACYIILYFLVEGTEICFTAYADLMLVQVGNYKVFAFDFVSNFRNYFLLVYFVLVIFW